MYAPTPLARARTSSPPSSLSASATPPSLATRARSSTQLAGSGRNPLLGPDFIPVTLCVPVPTAPPPAAADTPPSADTQHNNTTLRFTASSVQKENYQALQFLLEQRLFGCSTDRDDDYREMKDVCFDFVLPNETAAGIQRMLTRSRAAAVPGTMLDRVIDTAKRGALFTTWTIEVVKGWKFMDMDEVELLHDTCKRSEQRVYDLEEAGTEREEKLKRMQEVNAVLIAENDALLAGGAAVYD